jgi:signal transduction histidine kinase
MITFAVEVLGIGPYDFLITNNFDYMVLVLKKIIMAAAMLAITLAATAQPSAQEQEEQAFAQRIYEAQMSGNDSAFYDAHKAFMDYLEQREDWEKYYRAWMNRVLYDMNHKHYHRAFTQVHHITEDIRERHQEKYLYVPNMCLGLYYNSRNQPEIGEEHFRRALRGIDTEREPVAVFNCYLSLAQSLSFKHPAEAMACLDSLPQPMLQNPMYESGVLGYRCIIANVMGDDKAFNSYYARYDSIRQNLPEQFNAANLQQVMVCRCLMQNDHAGALAWCDSIDVPLVATELRMNVYEHMGDWERAFHASELKDSLSHAADREVLEETLADITHDIDLLQTEHKKAEARRTQLIIVVLMAIAIIALLVALLIYRYQKNRRLKEQFLQLQEARRSTKAGQAIRRAFVSTIQEKLKSPINILRGYARIFNTPDFNLNPEDRNKRYHDIVSAAKSIESLMDPVLDSYANGTAGITQEEKRLCQDALRSPLQTLIGTAEFIIDANGQIPHEEYMQLRSEICRDAYHVATSTNKLVLFSLYGDDIPTPKDDFIGLNEMARSVLNSYDLHREPSLLSTEKKNTLAKEFNTDVADDVKVHTSSLMQELLNCLLDNVDKYATGGTVVMSCHAETDGTYSISVCNEGPTIPAADAERIFEPFVRLLPDEHSLGIGLSLARRLAISMGYTLTLDQEYTDGARFVVAGI